MAFRALVLHEEGGKVRAGIETVDEGRLPEGDVTVEVSHSTLNYKDGLVLNGLGRLVRTYPHVPGIDFAGTVADSAHPAFKPGDPVVLTGWRVGELRWGGYAEKARVKGDWLVPLADGLTPERAMAIGTAGLTAMLAVMALEEHGLKPENGPVLVTGAAGGLGSVAVALLARLGYAVAAGTGRVEQHDYLKSLGATEIVDRATLETPTGKPLNPERWAGVVDAVGGKTLGNVLTHLKTGAAVAACGNAGGVEFSSNVLPFLLRGVNLLGIDSVPCPIPRRRVAWDRLARELPLDLLDGMVERAGLADLPDLGARILKGQVRGRVVVEVRR